MCGFEYTSAAYELSSHAMERRLCHDQIVNLGPSEIICYFEQLEDPRSPINKCALALISRVLDLNNQAFTGFGQLCHRDLKSQEIRLYTAKHNLLQILT